MKIAREREYTLRSNGDKVFANAQAAGRYLDANSKAGEGAFDLEGLKYAFAFLAEGKPLPKEFSDHELKHDWAHRREFHLAGDDLVIYQRKPRLHEVVLLRADTHKELFRRRARSDKK